MCSLPSPRNASTVHSVVSIARSSAESADSLSSASGAPSRATASDLTMPAAKNPRCLRGALEIEQRAGIGRARASRRDLPGDAAANRLVHELPERSAVHPEDLERLVDVIGQQESSDRIDRPRGIDLIDRRFGRIRSIRRRIDETEQHARRDRHARPESQRRGEIGHAAAHRDGGLVERQVQRAAEGIDDARACDGEVAGAQERRILSGLDGIAERAVALARTHEPVVVDESEQLLANPVETGRHDVEMFDRVGNVGERGFGRFVGLAFVLAIALIFGDEPVANGRTERGRRAGRDGAAAEERALLGRRPLVGREIGIDRTEMPALEPVGRRRAALPIRSRAGSTAATRRSRRPDRDRRPRRVRIGGTDRRRPGS